MVSSIKFKNFKIFAQEQILELRPITILIGKNNSGKSAVAKLPTLIAPPLRGEPLNWVNKIGDDTVELGSDFSDLVYNRNNTGSLELGMYADDEAGIEVVYNKEYGILEYNGEAVDENEHIKGFLMNGEVIPNLFLNIDYIGAIRTEPDSTYIFSNRIFKNIGLRGQNAYAILIRDYVNDAVMIKKVSEWYERNFEGWKINIDKINFDTEVRYEFKLCKDRLEVSIRQTGQGIHQVLPLIVRSFMPETQPTLIIIEEPETHLHPAAHGDLAQRFAESCIEDKNKRYLIETHSSNFVLRMRRLVAEKKLSPQDLAIYYVDFDERKRESTLRNIEVDEKGNLPNNDWPQGVFNETTLEVKAIIQAQRNN